MKDPLDRKLDAHEAETAWIQFAQTLIQERVDLEFCMDIQDLCEGGTPFKEAFLTILGQRGFHFKPDAFLALMCKK